MTTMPAVDNLLLLVKVSRVPGWCFGPILYTIGVINARAIPRTMRDLLRTALFLFALSFPLCIIVFGVNDVYDYETDLRNPRKQSPAALEGGVLAPAQHAFVFSSARYASVFILAAIGLAACIPSQDSTLSLSPPQRMQLLIITFLIISLGWAYSTPPFRMKERPLIDSLSNGCIVWLCWALGYASSGRDLPIFSFIVGSGSPDASAHKGWLLALCTSGVHAMGAVADVKADFAAGQTTIATAFGARGASVFAVIMYTLAFTTTDSASFVGFYTIVGAAVALLPALKPTEVVGHGAFQAIVCISVIGAMGWIGERAYNVLKVR